MGKSLRLIVEARKEFDKFVLLDDINVYMHFSSFLTTKQYGGLLTRL